MSVTQESQGSDEGWIEWRDGECPVSEDAFVVVRGKFTDGQEEVMRAGFWAWDHNRPKSDRITAYRIHKES